MCEIIVLTVYGTIEDGVKTIKAGAFGPGISKEDQEKLFQRFTQVGNTLKQGWGLGLAISKEFIEAQNSKIWVESGIGKVADLSFLFLQIKVFLFVYITILL